MKTAIIVNKKVMLADRYNWLTMEIAVPAIHLQEMKEKLNCKILNKREISVNFNHHAGKVYAVTINVNFEKILPYMQRSSVYEAENKDIYLSLLLKPYLCYGWEETNLPSDNVKLYAFSDREAFESKLTKMRQSNVLYYSVSGEKISLVKSEQNRYGEKRYINFKGKLYSNRVF